MSNFFNGLFVALILFFTFDTALAQTIPYTPERGTAERKAILDAIRPAVERDLRKPVQFVVRTMNVGKGWAFVVVDPQRPGGQPIDIRQTGLAAQFYDGLTTYAMVQGEGINWHAKAVVIGPTDVVWYGWWDDFGAPKVLFPKLN